MSRPRVRVPKTAAPGDVIEIKTLLNHPMESGQRKDQDGNTVPRLIIHSFNCTFNGEPVFNVDLLPSISANPYLQFTALVQESGTFEFTWVDDAGETYSAKKKIKVS